jgi:hypothetical protein
MVSEAFNLNGTNAYATVDDSPDLYPSGSFTVGAWIKTSKTTGTQVIMSHSECSNTCAPGANSSFELSVINGKLSAFIKDNTGASQTLAGNTLVANGGFRHVALQRDITNQVMRLYLDGAVEASAALGPGAVLRNDDGEADPLVIGAAIATGGAPANFFSGMLDEVVYFNRASLGQRFWAYSIQAVAGCAAGASTTISCRHA